MSFCQDEDATQTVTDKCGLSISHPSLDHNTVAPACQVAQVSDCRLLAAAHQIVSLCLIRMTGLLEPLCCHAGSGSRPCLTPPPILVKMDIVKPNTVWHVKKAIYGLREAPRLRQEERDQLQKAPKSPVQGFHRLIIACEAMNGQPDCMTIMF